jgi:hypothetical protein
MSRVQRKAVTTPSPATEAAAPQAPATPKKKPAHASGFQESLAPNPAAAVAVRSQVGAPSAPLESLWSAGSSAVLGLAQGVLKQLGKPATPDDAKKLLSTAPEVAHRLALLATAPVAAAVRHLEVNAPGDVPAGSGNAAADAKAYAQDVGFDGLKLENGRATLSTASGPVDLGAMPADASLGQLGAAINQQRFGIPSVVPPPALQPGEDFKIDNAHLAVHLSSLAYRDEATVKSQLEQWGYDTSTFSWIENKDTDTQGFVVKDKEGNTFVTFRGTESAQDAKTDADVKLQQVTWGGQTMQMHRGFATALDSVWSQVQAAVKKARGSSTDDHVVFTGHSLGGALATAAGLRANLEKLTPDNPRTSLYPVASPRVGDTAFETVFNERLPQTFRVVNFASGMLVDTQDIVTQIPPRAMGYRHVGNLVQLEDDKFTLINKDSPEARSMALESMAPAGAPAHDRRDATNSKVESLSGDELTQYMLWVAMQNRETPPAPAHEMALEMVVPSVSFHKSGLYLGRTGSAVLKED